MLKIKSKKNFSSILILILILSVIFDFFLNSYLVLKKNYSKRLIDEYGYCKKQSYGFIKEALSQFEIDPKSLHIKNFDTNVPSSNWMAGKFRIIKNKNKIEHEMILNAQENQLSANVIFSKKNCYLIKY